MAKPGFQKRPINKPTDIEQEIDSFIEGAERSQAPVAVQSTEYPWNGEGVRADVTKAFNLCLPEPDLLKLKFIAEQTPHRCKDCPGCAMASH